MTAHAMMGYNIAGGLIALGLIVYLFVALVRPDKF
jgi:K+-transporting ATPase KdpF subunit